MKKPDYQHTIKSSSARRKPSKSLISPALAELRKEIDTIDKDIWSLLGKRFALTKKVAKIKHKLHISVYDGKREQAVIAEINARTADPGVASAISRLYKLLFAISRKYQESYAGADLRAAQTIKSLINGLLLNSN